MLNVWNISYASPFKIHVLEYKVYVRFSQFNQKLGDFLSITSINVANDHKWYVCVCVCMHKYTHTSGRKYGASYWSTMWQKDRGTMSGHYSDPCCLRCTIIPICQPVSPCCLTSPTFYNIESACVKAAIEIWRRSSLLGQVWILSTVIT